MASPFHGLHATNQTTMQEHAQYPAAANVPLIKSPSLRVPKPVEIPEDMFPLPPNINEYFAYPFTLEPHILTVESARRATIAAHAARREEYLRQREDEYVRRKRDALRRVAPGFEPERGILKPHRVASAAANTTPHPAAPSSSFAVPKAEGRSVMDDLVDQLASMDARR